MARSNKDYGRTRRDSKSKVFYNSNEWLTIRGKVLSMYHGLDVYQLMINGEVVYADTVHHIHELKEHSDLALDIGNLIPMSSGTHSYIHKLYKKDKIKAINELIYIMDTFDTTTALIANT
jgi:hypothetical protein